MKRINNILVVAMMLISIFNIYKIIDCYTWINTTSFWDGGLGAAEIYFCNFLLAMILQIVNVLLTIVCLIHEEKINKFIWISLLIIIGTFFIPIYKFYVLYPYNNLYNIPLF